MPAQQSSPEAAATAEAATAVQQNTTGINENMSLAETRQQALDDYNAGQISEQTLDQILDDIDAQEELNGSGISLEAELNRLKQEPAAQHSISEPGSFNDLPIREQNALLGKKPIQLSRKDWAKVNNARMQRYSSLEDSDIPEIDIFYIAEYNKINLGYSYAIRNYSKDSFSAISKKRIKPDIAEIADLEEQSYGRNEESQRTGENTVSKGSSERTGAGRSFNSRDRGELRENAGGVAAEGESNENLGHWKGDTDSGAGGRINENTDAQHSIGAPAERQNIIRDLRSILDRGGDPNELRRYVTRLEQGLQTADRTASISGQESTESQRILQAARDRGIGVEEYLEQNWERYDVDGQWNDAARQALELEQGQSRRQYSISNPSGYDTYDEPINESDIQMLHSIGRKSVNAFTSEDIQKTQKWAHKFYQSLGVKSPFFRAWFGEWRENDVKKIVPVEEKSVGPLQNGRATNTDSGVTMSWNAHDIIRETQMHAARDRISVSAIGQLPEIIENAILLDTTVSTPSSKSKMPNTAFMHSFYAVYKTDTDTYIIKLYAEMALNNKGDTIFTRAYQLKDVKKVAVLGNGVLEGEPSLSGANTATINSISDLVKYVKQYDSEYNPKPASEVVNDDGTPKVVYHGSADLFDTFSYGHIGSASGVSVLGDGFYFTDQKKLAKNYGENVYECYLQMKTPYMANAADSYRLNTTQLKAQGYDGVILNAPNGNVYMVFDNTQIKSATDNIGTFDGNDPNIRHSISEAPGTQAAQDTADDFTVENEVEDVRSVLPKKARDYLKRTERTLLNNISRNLGVPWFAQREYLQPLVEEISNEYLKNGTISKETVDRLFDTAYDEGVVVDREFYDQYKEVKDYLRRRT